MNRMKEIILRSHDSVDIYWVFEYIKSRVNLITAIQHSHAFTHIDFKSDAGT